MHSYTTNLDAGTILSHGKMKVMNDRFQVFKSKNFDGLYAIFDNEEKTVIATADSLREAN